MGKGVDSAWGLKLVGFPGEVQTHPQGSLQAEVTGHGPWGNPRLGHTCPHGGPERGKFPGALCLEASRVFHFTD